MYDDVVLEVFLEKQEQLFDEPVAETKEEAELFLDDCMAQVVEGKKELIAYFEELGVDFNEDDIENEAEVFDLEDGRYLIVEG